MMHRITAILTVFRRPYTLQRQLKALRHQSVSPSALWCFVQEPSLELSQEIHCSGFDRVIECTPNSFYHFRFAVALAAQTNFVAIFDDDAIPGTRWLENCLETFTHCPGILGTHGTRLTGIQNAHDYRHRERLGWIAPTDSIEEVDYVGQAWFTKPEWLRFLFAERLATDRNGEDIELSARAWRLAGIPSYCPPHPLRDPELWGCQDNLLNQDENASSRRPSWVSERLAIIHAELSAGWSLTSMRHAAG